MIKPNHRAHTDYKDHNTITGNILTIKIVIQSIIYITHIIHTTIQTSTQ